MVHEVSIHDADDLTRVLTGTHPLPDRHLGELLIAQGIIDEEQLRTALIETRKTQGLHLGTALVSMGYAAQNEVNRVLAEKFGIPIVRLDNFSMDPEMLGLLAADVAMQYNVLPLAHWHDRLVLAMENPFDWEAIAAVRFSTNHNVEPVLCAAPDISRALEQHYNRLDDSGVMDELSIETDSTPRQDNVVNKDYDKAPVVRLVNAILLQAINRGASDINIRPERDRVNVFYRIDGKEQFVRTLHKQVLPSLVSRIKITGGMDIAERRLPQDGHARIMRDEYSIDLRISIMPTVVGESVVIRILDKNAAVKTLDELGYASRELDQLRQIFSRNNGMFLVTGPTGSGKSTTLYAVLHEIAASEPHIITVEDPVEYQIAGVEQIQIMPHQGYTFAEALRHILRHDPDVIMVGEIRDLETAQIANKAALTGHLVLSTLHTNDAASAVTRLIDLGVEPYLLSSTLLGVMAQRLIRLNCPHCTETETVDPLLRSTLGVADDEVFSKGAGCVHCNYTGYHGRAAVCELLPITQEIAELANRGAATLEIKQMAQQQGMKSITENALALARAGRTSLEEAYHTRLE